jgi:AbrB family looped-hinge helix DNA binding protein
METSTTTSKGQIVIPRKLRAKYGIKPGTKVGFLEKDGELVIKALTKKHFESLAGWLKDGPDLIAELMKEKKTEREL